MSSKTEKHQNKIGFLSVLDESVQSDLSLDFLDHRLEFVSQKSMLEVRSMFGKRAKIGAVDI